MFIYCAFLKSFKEDFRNIAVHFRKKFKTFEKVAIFFFYIKFSLKFTYNFVIIKQFSLIRTYLIIKKKTKMSFLNFLLFLIKKHSIIKKFHMKNSVSLQNIIFTIISLILHLHLTFCILLRVLSFLFNRTARKLFYIKKKSENPTFLSSL